MKVTSRSEPTLRYGLFELRQQPLRLLLRQPASTISSVMTTEELFQAVDWIKVTMIAVATGGPRINEVNSEFATKYDELAKELASRRVKNTFKLLYLHVWQTLNRIMSFLTDLSV